jgi:hypothetical protein
MKEYAHVLVLDCGGIHHWRKLRCACHLGREHVEAARVAR